MKRLEEAGNFQAYSEHTEDFRGLYRKAIALSHIAELVHRANARGNLKPFLSHLTLLPTCKFAQNDPAFFDEGSNKVFELLFGLLCGEVGEGTLLEDPLNPKGNNPDVLVTIDARRWGFACKVLSGDSPQTFFERIEEGISQIESSETEVGSVVFNLKNILDHDAIWPKFGEAIDPAGRTVPLFGVYQNHNDAMAPLWQTVAKKRATLVNECSKERVSQLFSGKKSIPASLLFVQTAAIVMMEGGPTPSNCGLFSWMNFDEIQPPDLAVLHKLTQVLGRQYPS